MRVKQTIHFYSDPQRFHRIGIGPKPDPPPPPEGRIPRVSRLMALAIRFDRMISEGKVDSQTTLAALAHVTQPRMNQILSLNYLAPDIQEAILHLPRTQPSETAVHEKGLRSICAEDCWKKQREMWNKLMPLQRAEAIH